MNKMYIRVLALVLLLLALPWNHVAAEGPTSGSLGETVSWEFKDGTLTISGEGYMEGSSQNDDLPWQHLREEIKTIVISEGVLSIGGWVFRAHANVTKVHLPSTLQFIRARAFADCRNLTEITIPSKVTSIGEYAFKNCESLKSIVLPDGVTEMGTGVFEGCTGLETVALPGQLERLSPSTFRNCTGLTGITLPKSMKSIGWYAFYRCENLKTVEIKGKITSIDYNAFGWCASLESLELPSSLEELGNEVFKDCRNIREIRFSGDMPTLGDGVFNLGGHDAGIPCNVYYPLNNKTWTQEKMDKVLAYYNSYVTFVPYAAPECDHDVVVVPGKEATCTEEGLTEKQYCSICDKVLKKQKAIDALGHDLVTATIPPTCTDPGYDLHQCSRCEYAETGNPVEAAGHSFGDWETVLEPTVEETGLETRKCLNCEATEERELEKLTPPPTEPAQTVPPTTAPGETEPAPMQPEPPAPRERAEAGLWILVILLAVAGAIVTVKILTKKKT